MPARPLRPSRGVVTARRGLAESRLSGHQPLVERLLHRFSVVIPPLGVIPNAHVSICRRQLRSHLWIYFGDRFFVYRCIWDVLGEPMVVLPGYAIGDQPHRLLFMGCSFRNYQVVSGLPPEDLLPDSVEFIERPIHIEGVKVLRRHAVAKQRYLQCFRWALTKATLSRELLGVEEVGPTAWSAVDLLGVVSKGVRVEHAGDAVLSRVPFQDRLFVDDGVVERLEEVCCTLEPKVVADVHHIPDHLVVLYHGLDLGVVGG